MVLLDTSRESAENCANPSNIAFSGTDNDFTYVLKASVSSDLSFKYASSTTLMSLADGFLGSRTPSLGMIASISESCAMSSSLVGVDAPPKTIRRLGGFRGPFALRVSATRHEELSTRLVAMLLLDS
jgi:hypothetical protein